MVIGNPTWTEDVKFSTLAGRVKNSDKLDKLVEEWTIKREAHEVMDILQRAGVAAGMLQRGSDTLNDPQIKARGSYVEVDHPVTGKKLYPNIPFRLSRTPPVHSVPAPFFGQHTDEICRELLEMPTEEIDKLKAEGVLEDSSI